MSEQLENEAVVESVRQWVDAIVIELNLCPFAGIEREKNRVRFAVTRATTEECLLKSLQGELALLDRDWAIETTLLIHPDVLQDFDSYNQFLNRGDELLVQMSMEGVYQIASFHPRYQFAGTQANDAENYTNRSPFPMLHLLREVSMERAIAEYPDVDKIPTRNIALMKEMGSDKLRQFIQACVDTADE